MNERNEAKAQKTSDEFSCWEDPHVARRSVHLRFLLVSLLMILGLTPSKAAQNTDAMFVGGAVSGREGSPDSARQGTIVRLKVTNLYALDQRAFGKVIFFLDDMLLKGLYPIARDTVGDTPSFQ